MMQQFLFFSAHICIRVHELCTQFWVAQKSQRGAALVTLLMIVATGMVLVGAMSMTLLNTMQSVTTFTTGHEVYYAAEAGIENGLLRFIRDPSYPGEELTIGGATVTITVVGSDPVEITAVAQNGTGIQRTVAVLVSNATGALEVLSWKEE